MYSLVSVSVRQRSRDYVMKVKLIAENGDVMTGVAKGTDLEELPYWAVNKAFNTMFKIIKKEITEKEDGGYTAVLKIEKPDVTVTDVGESEDIAFINAYLQVVNMTKRKDDVK